LALILRAFHLPVLSIVKLWLSHGTGGTLASMTGAIS
jgi:hypothetical protein